jgi:D-inositol-3-phosphate glycosyltransferase
VGLDEPGDLLLFVGRIEPLKGIDTLIHALAIMQNNGVMTRHRICLSIIGGEPGASPEQMSVEMARLRMISSEYGLEDMVTFIGKRDQDSLPYYYSAAAIVVVPSHYESFGMVALEAMACGTPVVASQVGGLAFLVQDGLTGYHVPGDDPQAIAEKLVELLDTPGLRQEMGERAAAYARGYSWEVPANQLLALYWELLDVKGSATHA